MRNPYTNKEMTIDQTAYQKYQYDWLAEHGYSISDVVENILTYANEAEDEDTINVNDLVSDWELECGMNGSLYVCYEEFLNAEYQDKEYMRCLLTDDEYRQYIEERYRQMLEVKLTTDNPELEEMINKCSAEIKSISKSA